MDDENISFVDIIDCFIDDARVLVIYINVILMMLLFVSADLSNTTFFNIMAWITVVITAIDVLLTIIDVIGGFANGNIGGGIISSIINAVIISIAVTIAAKFVDLTGVQLSQLGLIAVGATVFACYH